MTAQKTYPFMHQSAVQIIERKYGGIF